VRAGLNGSAAYDRVEVVLAIVRASERSATRAMRDARKGRLPQRRRGGRVRAVAQDRLRGVHRVTVPEVVVAVARSARISPTKREEAAAR
jgi:hypothetical protein